ncbi:MAG TPA: hypothetical protein VLH85_09140 [Levilinea sp.]|nr:hypothetical protein [Levilinea sp.]
MWNHLVRILAANIALFLSGCAALWAPLTPGGAEPTPVVPPVETAPPYDPLAEAGPEVQCAYVWDSRPLPEFTLLLQAAYRTAQMEDVVANVSGYGENCLDPDTKEIVRFEIMRSDFYLSITVEDVDDRDALGRKLSTAMMILQRFPEGTFLGTQPPSVLVRFEGGENITNLSFSMAEYDQALGDGLAGAALFDALD